jgi:hypothetical protein
MPGIQCSYLKEHSFVFGTCNIKLTDGGRELSVGPSIVAPVS